MLPQRNILPLNQWANVVCDPAFQPRLQAYMATMKPASMPYTFDDYVQRFMRSHQRQSPDLLAPSFIFAGERFTNDHGNIVIDQLDGSERTTQLLRAALEVPAQSPPLSRGKMSSLLPKEVIAKLLLADSCYDYWAEDAALQSIMNELRETQPHALAGVQVLAHLHVLPSNLALFRCLKQLGAHVRVLPKPRSTDQQVLQQLIIEGFDLSTEGRVEARHLGYHPADPEVLRFITTLGGRKGLLLDDGGHLHSAAAQVLHLATGPLFGVEQTAQGRMRLERKNYSPHYAIVDVGHSWLKLQYESPAIGEDIVLAMATKLRHLSPHFDLPHRRVLVVGGAGNVGRAAAQALQRHDFIPILYDLVFLQDTPNADKARRDTIEQGFIIADSIEAGLTQACIVVSCTGSTPFTLQDYRRMATHDLILFNGASGNHEFGVEELSLELFQEGEVRHAQMMGHSIVLPASLETQTRHRLFAPLNGVSAGHVLLMENGYVVNRDTDIRAPYLPTIAALLAACAQAVSSATASGWCDLNDASQQHILAAAEKQLRQLGAPPLSRPDFSQLPSAPTVFTSPFTSAAALEKVIDTPTPPSTGTLLARMQAAKIRDGLSLRHFLLLSRESLPELLLTQMLRESDLNAQDACGRSIAHYAAALDPSAELLVSLESAGSDLTIKDKWGLTPRYYLAIAQICQQAANYWQERWGFFDTVPESYGPLGSSKPMHEAARSFFLLLAYYEKSRTPRIDAALFHKEKSVLWKNILTLPELSYQLTNRATEWRKCDSESPLHFLGLSPENLDASQLQQRQRLLSIKLPTRICRRSYEKGLDAFVRTAPDGSRVDLGVYARLTYTLWNLRNLYCLEKDLFICIDQMRDLAIVTPTFYRTLKVLHANLNILRLRMGTLGYKLARSPDNFNLAYELTLAEKLQVYEFEEEVLRLHSARTPILTQPNIEQRSAIAIYAREHHEQLQSLYDQAMSTQRAFAEWPSEIARHAYLLNHSTPA